ncbi:hypothetical protein GASC598I20_004820 [Gilliamella apicola SCGC AB-598-I20]|nr:hypothetical protein GASC598I20_004820 [Gilliamella apicola SCGC AB-598-I20]
MSLQQRHYRKAILYGSMSVCYPILQKDYQIIDYQNFIYTKKYLVAEFCTNNKSNALIYLNIDTIKSMNGDVDLIVSLRF